MKFPVHPSPAAALLTVVSVLASISISVAADDDATKPSTEAKTVSPDHAQKAKQGIALFKQSVREILSQHCLDCHGGKSVKADFDLSNRDALIESGYVTETAADSHLMQLITHESEPHMPLQAERLSEASIDLIRQWIDLGAPYDKPLVEDKQQGTPGSLVVTDEDRKFWAFRPLQPTSIPNVQNEAWCRTPIDRFVLAKQEAEGLSPNPVAEPRTLVRRATFDLLGLPATADQVDALIAEGNLDAWPKWVDQLLESPHYGERWARHWMDVARFAESHGYEQDYDRPHAYHYRDFLIKAFNQDMPFDQFVKWQLAGDELAPDDPLALMATGFLAGGAFPTQLTEAEFESARYDELDDMVTTTGVAFLGLSVGCARCHDHKFDPIPSYDYYRMAATFTSAIRSEVDLDLEPEANRRRQLAWEARLGELQHQLTAFEQQQVPKQFAKWLAQYQPDESQDPWRPLNVIEIESTGGSTFQSQSDGSWLAIGNAPPKEVLSIVAKSDLRIADKLRLEALTDDSLPHRGPGRADNGNFALGDVQVSVVTPAVNVGGEQSDTSHPVMLRRAAATHQQNTETLSVNASIDKDPISGWAVDGGGIGKDQAAVFEFGEAIELTDQSRLIIKLTFEHPNNRHAIGRFRLSLSNREDAPVAVGSETFDPAIQAALLESKTTGDQDSPAWKMAMSWFATTLPEYQRLQQAISDHRKAGSGQVLTKVMIASEGRPHMKHHADDRGYPHFYPETFFLNRGDVDQKQEAVTSGYLQVLMPADASVAKWAVQTPASSAALTSYRRASMAQWMTDVDGGAGALVARVIVNRVWQHHFGQGLVATPNDFGVSGDPPSHPELLDWLASDLIEHGWQLKRLHHLIMTSSVYMQSAEHDEARASIDRENKRLWRWTPRRLEAEAIRDSMLVVSGKLDPTMYGPGTLNQNMNRRSVYFFIKRSKLIPMMMLFDWPEHLVSIGQRSSTTIAPQALMFLNSPQGREYAESLAKRLPSGSFEEAVREVYRLALVREPRTEELELGLAFLSQQEAMYRQQQVSDPRLAATIDLCQTLMSLNEFVYIE